MKTRLSLLRRCARRILSSLPLTALLASQLPAGWAAQASTNIISGVIGVPGERDSYVFSVAADSRYYFDALSNVGNLQWSLKGAAGTLVANRSFAGSDGQNITDPVLPLPAGDYTLTIESSTGTTNAYAFRWFNLADATLLVPGSPVSGTLAPANGSGFYQFTAAAGDRFFFDQLTKGSLPNAYWRLIDPYNNQVFSQGFSDVGSAASPSTLPASGTYLVLVEGYIGDPGNGTYSFNVVPEGSAPPPPFTGTPLVLGDLVVSNLVANATNAYVFTLANRARLVFDSQTNTPNLNWTLEGPGGVEVNQRGFNSSDGINGTSVLDLPAGGYQLRVRGNDNNSYRFRLLDLSSATSFTPGSVVPGQLFPATATALFRFNASAGARMFFDSLAVSNAPNAVWKLLDPFGHVQFSTGIASDQGPFQLPATGSYTLLVEGYLGDSGNSTFTFNVVPVIDDSQALVIGSVVNGAIGSPGQRQFYSFTLPAGARLHFDSRTNLGTLHWSLDGPAGNLVNARPFNASDGINFGSPVLDLPAGDYVLSVAGVGAATGGYAFRLLDLAAVPALPLGAPVSGTLSPANETDAFQFTVPAPGKFYLAFISVSGMPNVSERLVDAHGNLFINTSGGNNVGPINLPAGSYLLLLEGYHSDLGDGTYTFNFQPVTDATQSLAIGDVVTGSVTAPAQLQRYTFRVATASRLYFDSRTNGPMRWSLDGLTGNIVNNRGFSGSDGVNFNSPVLALPAGDYTLTVSANGNSTGGYQFRLLDLAAAAAMSPGTPVNGTLNPANETDAYQFNLAVAGRYFFDSQGVTGLPNAYARVVDGAGILYLNGNLGSDAGPFDLPAGSYTLLVEGYVGEAGSGSYTFNLNPVGDAIQSLLPGTLVTGSVSNPGQVRRYTFSLPAAARLHFDSRTNGSTGLRWSLNGPNGLLVNNRSFGSSDGLNYPNPVLALPSGDYTLAVSAGGDGVGPYQFLLLDLATVPSFSPGVPIVGTLNPANETDAYQFALASPAKLFFDSQSVNNLPNAYARLVDAHGTIFLSGNLASDVGPFNVPAGSYTLLVEGYHSDPGAGAYTVNLVPVNDGTQALTFDSTINGTIGDPGQSQVYTFNLSTAAKVYFDSLFNSGLFRWSLDGPVGNVVANRALSASDAQSIGNPLLLLPPGAYTLTVSASGDTAGSFQFRLLNLANAPVLSPGTPVSVVNSPANQTSPYRFTAAAGDRFFFDYQSSASMPNAYWRLLDPYGKILFGQGFSADAGTNTLAVAGTYTVLIEGYIGDVNLGAFAFNVQPAGNVPPGAFTGAPLVLGPTQSGNLAAATTTNAYTFTLGVASRLYFDALSNASFAWSLLGPGGVWINNRSFQGSDHVDAGNPLLELPAGDYQLTVTGSAGAYQFRLLDFAAATAIVPGNVVSNALAPARSTVLYRFNGGAGQQIYFDGQLSSGFTYPPYVRLYGPLGNILMAQNVNADVDTFTLNQAGAYTVTVEGRIFDNNAIGNYAFAFLPVSNGSNTLTIGATVTASTATPGQRDYYAVTLAGPRRLYFDALTNTDFYWRLDAPWGQVINWRAFTASDGADVGDPLLDLAAGSYTLTVAANNFTFAGDYRFRLLDFAAAAPFTPGNLVSNILSPARMTELYRFTGTAGQRMYFDGRPAAGFVYVPYVRVYGPSGNIVAAQNINSDGPAFSLPQTGTYTLLVEGRIYDNNASGTYSFNLQPFVDTTNTLAVGPPVFGSITALGQIAYYSFSLAQPRQLYFDALTNADFYWRLDASRGQGQILDWRSFVASDSADIGNPMLPLAAGDYTLAVAANNFAFTGDYQFRLLDFSDATAFALGTVVSNTLAPARSTEFYQFAGSAGQRVYFDGRPSSGFTYQPWVRIFGPLGNILLSQPVNGDQDSFFLPQSGTYTLAVEGRVYDNNASGTYAFSLFPVSYPTNNLAIGAVTAASITTLGQRQYYLFSLPAATNLYFDSLTNGGFSWRLDAPWGQVLDWRSFAASDGADISNPLLALAAGDYTMTVAANQFAATGDYRFRLLSARPAPAFTPGNVVSNTLAPANSTVFYQFTGAAGARYYFDGQLSSGFTYTPYVRIYAPAGNAILAQNVNADVDTFTLPQSGVYTLLVEGRVFDANASGSYAFNLVPNPANPPLPLFQTNDAPDLVVSAISVAPASVQSGDSITVHWTVQNAGSLATAGTFTDRVTIRNAANDQIIVNSTLVYNEGSPGNGPIAPGATRDRQLGVTLPDGTNSAGTLVVTVTTDTQNNILEQNAGGTAEANNSASMNLTTTLAPYPDLRVQRLTTSPAPGWPPNTVVTVQWRVTNAGPRATTGSWSDGVVLRNLSTAQVLLNTSTNYLPGDPGNGPIGPGEFRDRALTFVVPNNANAYGTFEILVTADSANQLFEFVPGLDAETNNSATLRVQSAPDLTIENIQVTGAPSLESGAAVTVTWNTVNHGNVDTGGSFYDRVRIRNVDTAEVLVDSTSFYNPATAGNGAIPPGGARARASTFNLPNGPRGAGALEVTVSADAFNNLIEENGAGTGEANNAATRSVSSALAPAPDLRVVNLTVQPATIASGTNLTIFWAVTNSGSSRATDSWYDRVQIVNTNAGVTLLDANVLFDTGGPGPLTNGTARSRSYSFTLPNNANGAGGLLITVTADRYDNVFEFNAGGTGESNNAASLAVLSGFSPLPDLAVHAITAPAIASAGQTIALVYVLTNKGTAAAVGSWFDTIFVSTDGTVGSDNALLNPGVSATLPAGTSLTRTQMVTIPINGDAGPLHFVVQTDSGNTLSELAEDNNVLLDPNVCTVPLALQLSLSAAQIAEDAVNPNVTATLTRNGSRAAALIVNVLSSDTTEMIVPATVVIPANLASLTFQTTVQQDGLYDGPQVVNILAGAAGYSSATATITVLDANIPRLILSFSTNRLVEGGPGLTAVIMREPVTSSSLTVQLSSPSSSQLSFPATATIQPNAASANFSVTAIDDLLVERTNTYAINAAAAGFVSSTATIIVEDNDVPSVTLTLAAHVISEGAGANATSGTVTRAPVTPQAVVIQLVSGNPAAAQVPGSVTIPPNQASASFSVAAINNAIVDGDRTAAIGGFILDSITGQHVGEVAPDALTITDDDGPTLTLDIAADVVGEGLNPATTAVVTRNAGTNNSLLVTLNSSDTTEATAPATVTIPAGSFSASFNIASIADGVTDGNQTVTFTASAPGFTSGSDTLVVSDADRPDLVVTSISFGTNGLTDQNLAVTFRVENRGLA